MQISEELWQEIIAETKAKLANFEAGCIADGLKDRFVVRVEALGKADMLLTEQLPSMYGPPPVVIRERDSRQMHRATRKRVGRDRFRISWKTSDPKSWAKLADKPVSDIVKVLKLADFVVLLGARITGVRSAGMSFDGRDFDEEQIRAIDAYQRDHDVDLVEAIERLYPQGEIQ